MPFEIESIGKLLNYQCAHPADLVTIRNREQETRQDFVKYVVTVKTVLVKEPLCRCVRGVQP